MKKLLFSLVLGFVVLTGLTIWLGLRKPESLSLDLFLKSRWPSLVEKIEFEKSWDLSSLISDIRPAELSNVDLLQPHYQDYDDKEIRQLFEFSRNCSASVSKSPSSGLRKALQWMEFQCHQKILPKDFFKRAPFLFPSGKSFVQLADENGFQFAGYLTESEIPNYRSLTETLAQRGLKDVFNLQQIKGLLAGEDVLFSADSVFVRQRDGRESHRSQIFNQIPRAQWARLFRSEDFILQDSFSANCVQKLSNACWVLNPNRSSSSLRLYQSIVIVADLLLMLTIGLLLILDRRRRNRQRERQRFALQMLTHELRTPATTLGVLTENIRPQFDSLPESVQMGFLQMRREILRLQNSMQMSYAYLQTDALTKSKMKIRYERIELVAYLTNYLAAPERDGVIASLPAETIWIEAEHFWLELCLNNLLQNASRHGRPPVHLQLQVNGAEVRLSVQDAGVIRQKKLDVLGEEFQKDSSSKGLGLGLSIIRQVMGEMRGRLEIERDPSRFSLVFGRRD